MIQHNTIAINDVDYYYMSFSRKTVLKLWVAHVDASTAAPAEQQRTCWDQS